MQTKEVSYKQGDTELAGFFAWDAAAKGKRPGVLVVHEWWGHNEHARDQAVRLAKAGYVGFALDMYGKGKVATHPRTRRRSWRRPPRTRRWPRRDSSPPSSCCGGPARRSRASGAIGYCFGGGVVLEMARQGVDLDAVVSFHGSIATEQPAAKGAVKARMLVLNGEDDGWCRRTRWRPSRRR